MFSVTLRGIGAARSARPTASARPLRAAFMRPTRSSVERARPHHSALRPTRTSPGRSAARYRVGTRTDLIVLGARRVLAPQCRWGPRPAAERAGSTGQRRSRPLLPDVDPGSVSVASAATPCRCFWAAERTPGPAPFSGVVRQPFDGVDPPADDVIYAEIDPLRGGSRVGGGDR